MDVSPAWVTSRWARVTTSLSSLEMEGLRVPLVTGTKVDDLAGSLTYYFNEYGQVQRLTFHGYTGNPQRITALATQYFGMQAKPSVGPGLFVAQWNGKPTSVLYISRAPVVSTDRPHAQLQVILEVNRPADGYRLSQQLQQFLEQDRRKGRW